MVDSLTKERFLQALERVLERLEGSADYLSGLDAAMGDGDFGISMTLGSRGVRQVMGDLAGQDIGGMVARAGMAFNGAAPSTIGALFAIGSMRGGKEAKGHQELDLPLLARMARAAETAIMEKGKAQRGDKTLLDSLGPAADALEAAAAEGRGLAEGLASAVEAARAGVRATIEMKSKSGRGSWIAERTVGHQDPGATAILLMLEALSDFVSTTQN